MKKAIDIICKIVLGIIIIMPIGGVLGLMPAPTADMYGNPEAFAFIQALMSAQYIMYIKALVFLICAVLIVMNRMALVALLLLPITVNIVGFHAFLDGGLLTSGAIMGNVLLLLNVYFLWQNRAVYQSLLAKSA